MQRYSRNRQAIIDCLINTTSHPTADWVYSRLKPDYPNMSLATVYRNLSQLKEAGVIRSVGTVNGQERFDGNIVPHTHVVCVKCGRMDDVHDVPLPEKLTEKVTSSTGYAVISAQLRFDGVCADCLEKQ